MTVAGYTKIGIIGAGSMGSEMAQLFAEAGLKVALFDIKNDNVAKAVEYTNANSKIAGMVEGFTDTEKLMVHMPSPGHRLFVFSLPHGDPADIVLDKLRPHLAKGDIVLDGGNEWYENTERRMSQLKHEQRVDWVGMGVSGGYQSARRGPSLSPGGDEDAIKRVMPLLEKVAAKDKEGNPCVARVGPGGSGHYVKMVHNGIEQGMMGAMAEAWGLLRFNAGLELDEIGAIFKGWNDEGNLRNTFLVDIAADICTKRDASVTYNDASDNADHILSVVLDKVVQDADDTEGTGTWSVAEAARVHIAAPSMACSHFLRLASADRAARLRISETLQPPAPPASVRTTMHGEEKARFVEDVRLAMHAACIASYVQGLQLVARRSEKEEWGVKLGTCVKIWRAGCIIASEGLGDVVEEVARAYDECMDAGEGQGKEATSPSLSSVIPAHPTLSRALTADLPALRRTVLWALERDACVPTLGASLEWVKYVGARILPTMFMEAQLDWFGAHRFERWDGEAAENGGVVKKGSEHYEWRAA
ncbi:hypothetical protein EIP86_001204 [Pleurotus ostreatoroseus]|nr:hypothetical protein EIP86_001204 [Pleurotus ostreatoroseus]